MAGVLLWAGCSTGAEVGDGTWFPPVYDGGNGDATDADGGTETGDEEESEADEGSSGPRPEPEPEPEPEPMGTTGEAMDSTTTDEPTPGTTGSTGGGEAESCAFVLLTNLGGLPLNVRAAPSVASALVGTMNEGEVVDVLAEVLGQPVNIPPLGVSDVWYEVDDGAVRGFVTSLYTECTDAP